jgi:MFS family permease
MGVGVKHNAWHSTVKCVFQAGILLENIMSSEPSPEIEKTKQQFLFVVTGEYFITGFFWVFSTLGSLSLTAGKGDPAKMLFFSMFILMLSNGVWEVLTGWYADKFKRQFSMSVGFLACFVGFILMGVAVNFSNGGPPDIFSPPFIVWNLGISIWSLGPALLSGAQEAWLVDRCNFFSEAPPEDVDKTFKTSAALGVIFKSLGTAICFLIFYWRVKDLSSEGRDAIVFILPGIIAAGLSLWLFFRSIQLREEYWSHPKYQTNESLLSFLWDALKDLCGRQFRWFTLGYVGVMSTNYVLSTTIWPYLASVRKDGALLNWGLVLIAAEVAGSVLSGPFSNLIDRIKQERARIPVASLMYLAPLLLLLFYGRYNPDAFLLTLIVAASLFRVAHASIFGSLNTIGQLAIDSDERRAVQLSMSSAISSFMMSVVFFIFFRLTGTGTGSEEVYPHFKEFWGWVPSICIAILIWGGYRATRPRLEA